MQRRNRKKMSAQKPVRLAAIIFTACLAFALLVSLCSHKSESSWVSTQQHRQLAQKGNINLACRAAQYESLCRDSLRYVREDAGPEEIIKGSITLSHELTAKSHGRCKTLLTTSTNSNFTTYVGNCIELLDNAGSYIGRSKSASLGMKVKDVEAWMSAALTWQTDCNNSFKYLTPSKLIQTTVSEMVTLINITSNTLSMIDALDTYGKDMSLWKPPVSERSNSIRLPAHFSNKSKVHSHKTWRLTSAEKKKTADIIVSKEDLSSMSIQEAINKAPENSEKKFIIYIKAGVYEEIVKVPPKKNNIVIYGDGTDNTVITGSRKVLSLPGNITTYSSATFAVNADGFLAHDITFENKAGLPTGQAVALRVDGDRSAFYNCAILGNQDSLYAHTLRQFFKNCRIEGNVDFIFGNSAAVFEDCTILVRPRQDKQKAKKGSTDPVTAQGRIDLAQPTGFVFNKCIINGTEQYMENFRTMPNLLKAYLGRPWKTYSRTIYMNSYFGEIISPDGWLPWSGDFALNTLFYGEYHNYGPGAAVTHRVPWSNVISKSHAEMYSAKNFIQSDEWLPV